MKIFNHKSFGIFIFILFPFINQAQSKIDSVHIQIKGKWAWTENVPTARGGSRGGIKHDKTTPLTCKCGRTLTITDDKIISNKNGNDTLIGMSSYEYRNGIQDNSNYSVREFSNYPGARQYIMIDSNILSGEISIYGDTLMIVSRWAWDAGGTDYCFEKIK